MALCGWLLSRHAEEAKQSIERDAIVQAEMWAQSVDRSIAGVVGTLRALAASSALKTRDYASFDEQAAASFSAAGVTVLVRDRRLALLKPDGVSPVDESDPPLSTADARQALTSPQAIVTEFRSAASTQPAGVDIWIRAGPTRGGEPLLLQARVPSEFIAKALAPASIETPWTVALIDPGRRVVARSRAFAIDLGGVLPEFETSPAAAAGFAAGRIWRGADSKGAPEIRAIAPSTIPGWLVVATAPRAAVESRLDEHWRGFLIVAAMLGLMMAGATSFVAATISNAVATLAANARTLPTRAPMTPVKTKIREVRDLMDAMTETRSELIRGTAALREADHRLRMALDAGGMGVWEWDRITDEMTWDPAEFDLAGLPRDAKAPSGQEFASRVLDEDRPRLTAALDALSPESPAFTVDFRFRRFDGDVRWIAGRGLLLPSDEGKDGLIGVNYDTTEQRLNADRTASLLREVSHRSKNMLALILAMARLTARDATDVQSHVKEFSARVAGLAASQDLIVAGDWREVDIASLAVAEVKAIAHDAAERFITDGPALAVSPAVAQTLGMVFAELALNAVQHGALSAARGRVDLTWTIDGGNLDMTWRESDGPPVVPYAKRGYGMSVVERFVEQGLQAMAHVTPKPEGLVWSLSAPLDNLGIAPAPPC